MNKKITIFIGNMGSGKSEIAINYSILEQKLTQKETRLLDLDIIKPYIRIRDVADKIELKGIKLLMSDKRMLNADMPIVPSHMIEYLTDPAYNLVLDVGGEERGCITIAQFKEYFEKADLSVNLVVNPFRPFSNTQLKVFHMIDSLQNQSKLSITGIVSNPHLRFETNLKQVISGTRMVEKECLEAKIPLKLICIWHKIVSLDFLNEFKAYQILPLRLFLTFPWENGLMEGI